MLFRLRIPMARSREKPPPRVDTVWRTLLKQWSVLTVGSSLGPGRRAGNYLLAASRSYHSTDDNKT